jgi:hypothetical protein
MLDPKTLFAGIPDGLRQPLVSAYSEIARNYSERRWEPSELNGGKLCEVIYTIVAGALSGSYATEPQKPKNSIDACRAFERRPANPEVPGDRSLRILIPRALPFLYEIRSNRGVGHVGGDVDPNFSDATAVFSCSNWLMAELIRIFHSVSLKDAQDAVDAMVERKHPAVWENDGVKRVLDPGISVRDQVLLLLYSSAGAVAEKNLRSWVEYSNVTHFRNQIVNPLHKDRYVEYDKLRGTVRITPRGAGDVEKRLLPKYA